MKQMIEQLKNTDTFFIAGHRGFMAKYPENTLIAFQKALDAGVDMLEFDLRFSKDSVLMVIHDDTVDRTTNGTGKVSEFTLSELKSLSAGVDVDGQFHTIPTLEEFCELLKTYPDVLFNVEIKPSPDAKRVAASAIQTLKDYDYLPRCVFTSFDAETVAYIHDVYDLRTQGFPGELMFNFVSGPNGTYSKMWAAGISMKLLTNELVEEFKDLGILSWCYCPDTKEQVSQALELGINVLTCNNPLPALEERKKQKDEIKS
jgi:glycerophosphoryl diester phosphodiesterase